MPILAPSLATSEHQTSARDVAASTFAELADSPEIQELAQFARVMELEPQRNVRRASLADAAESTDEQQSDTWEELFELLANEQLA